MPTITGRLGVATTPRGHRVSFRGWNLTYAELDPMNEWSGLVGQRNPLLLQDDAVNYLQFEADETGKVLFQGYGRLSRETPKDPMMSVESVSRLDHFPENEHFPPTAPTSIFSNDTFSLEVNDESDEEGTKFRYRLRLIDPK